MRKYDIVFILSSFSFSTVHLNNVSLTLHFTVRNILGLCSLLHINFSHSFFNYNLIYINISVHLIFISLYLCHYRLSCFVPQPHTATFDLFISLCMYITSSFYSLPILLCSTIPLTIFLSLVSLLYVKLLLHMVLPLHHLFTVTNIPSFCSVVHLSSFSVYVSFELPTAVLPQSQIYWKVNTA